MRQFTFSAFINNNSVSSILFSYYRHKKLFLLIQASFIAFKAISRETCRLTAGCSEQKQTLRRPFHPTHPRCWIWLECVVWQRLKHFCCRAAAACAWKHFSTRTQQRCRRHPCVSQGCFVTGERPRALLPNGTHIHTLCWDPRRAYINEQALT